MEAGVESAARVDGAAIQLLTAVWQSLIAASWTAEARGKWTTTNVQEEGERGTKKTDRLPQHCPWPGWSKMAPALWATLLILTLLTAACPVMELVSRLIQATHTHPQSPPSNSPIKQKQRLTLPDDTGIESSPGEDDMEQISEYSQKLDAIPTSGLPKTDITMTNKILTLRGTIQQLYVLHNQRNVCPGKQNLLCGE